MFETILVSDQNTERRNLLYHVLSDLNYRVTTVPSHKELTGVLNRERPRCVILATDEEDDSMTAAVHALRGLDKTLKVIALAPSSQTSSLSQAFFADPRILVLSGRTDHVQLIREILGFLKVPEVQQIDGQTSFHGTILVIEDEPNVAQLLTGYLERRGYHMTIVSNGEDALLQMRLKHPEVVILDILLPGMDGLLTLQQLKTANPSVTIIVTSGLDTPRVRQEALALGASTYFVKPVDFAKLEAAILTRLLQLPSTPSEERGTPDASSSS